MAVWAFFLVEHHKQTAGYTFENVDLVIFVLFLNLVEILQDLRFCLGGMKHYCTFWVRDYASTLLFLCVNV